jgi:hypothetical protein
VRSESAVRGGGQLTRCRRGPDDFEPADGKIKRFDCYPEGTIILGVLGNLSAALEH